MKKIFIIAAVLFSVNMAVFSQEDISSGAAVKTEVSKKASKPAKAKLTDAEKEQKLIAEKEQKVARAKALEEEKAQKAALAKEKAMKAEEEKAQKAALAKEKAAKAPKAKKETEAAIAVASAASIEAEFAVESLENSESVETAKNDSEESAGDLNKIVEKAKANKEKQPKKASENAGTEGKKLTFFSGSKKIKEPKPLVEYTNKIFAVIDWGGAVNLVTRVQKQSGRSNFVWQDMMVGGYIGVRTINIPFVNFYARLAAFYPLQTRFNGMQMFAKQTILYAVDFFLGPIWTFNLKYVRLSVSPGLHYMYQLTDQWHLNYLGFGLFTNIELPVSRRWTVIIGPNFTFDSANLGSNKKMFPYSASYSYQISLGGRYSRKLRNKVYYIRDKEKTYKNDTTTPITPKYLDKWIY